MYNSRIALYIFYEFYGTYGNGKPQGPRRTDCTSVSTRDVSSRFFFFLLLTKTQSREKNEFVNYVDYSLLLLYPCCCYIVLSRVLHACAGDTYGPARRDWPRRPPGVESRRRSECTTRPRRVVHKTE